MVGGKIEEGRKSLYQISEIQVVEKFSSLLHKIGSESIFISYLWPMFFNCDRKTVYLIWMEEISNGGLLYWIYLRLIKQYKLAEKKYLRCSFLEAPPTRSCGQLQNKGKTVECFDKLIKHEIQILNNISKWNTVLAQRKVRFVVYFCCLRISTGDSLRWNIIPYQEDLPRFTTPQTIYILAPKIVGGNVYWRDPVCS